MSEVSITGTPHPLLLIGEQKMDAARRGHTCSVEHQVAGGHSSSHTTDVIPRTMESLEDLLRREGRALSANSRRWPPGKRFPTKTRPAPPKSVAAPKPVVKLALPAEWGQSRQQKEAFKEIMVTADAMQKSMPDQLISDAQAIHGDSAAYPDSDSEGWMEYEDVDSGEDMSDAEDKPPISVLTLLLAILRGSVVDVAANGHCGWVAIFAALYNEEEGLEQPADSVTAKTNVLKRRVINDMLANLVDESKLHRSDMRAEAMTLGCEDGDAVQDSRESA
ncbi:unnamed protein product [Phytophthora fragariaefolia]|uniref:Unnamed protein product n=1 Tax=Phytophthora fragariaefolia TaxID=1490495 RepID=A0A9W7CY33_9STRA|nr:unnamed protein product [Phytophthora fragariaefolia]